MFVTRKNELFIDVIEDVNLLVSVDGKLLRSDVSGRVVMKCMLSGLPDCKLGLNDKIAIETAYPNRVDKHEKSISIDNCTFHQCVRLSKFDTDRTISFIPPDGEFELMKYRTSLNVKIPFKMFHNYKELSKSRLEIKITVKANFGRDTIADDVKIKIPVPKSTAYTKTEPQVGRAKYYPEESSIIWKIKHFSGESEFSMNAEVELAPTTSSSQKKGWSKPPIGMSFSVPMWTASGLQILFLRVVENKFGYEPTKWVKYTTQAGSYQYRF